MRTLPAAESIDAVRPPLVREAATELRRTAQRLEARVPGMRGHARRVAAHAALIALRIGLDRAAVARTRQAAALHDIGKAELPHEMLRAPRALSADEVALVHSHPIAGARIVSALGDEELTSIVRHHHERFDGGGYPDGLAGAAIPIGARIVAAADTFDAVTSERPYRPALDHAQARELLRREAGAQLDPEVVAAAISVVPVSAAMMAARRPRFDRTIL